MRIKDRVYGTIEIDDPLIIELIESSPLQRLKKIKQNGAQVFLDPARNTTRFEHSVGVWHLLKKYGASQAEQVAGILHDTPHTAFSHVIDFVFPNEDHNFHEKFTEKVILNSEVPEILKKHRLKVEDVLATDNFHLLEADLPDLSADRIDYFLRDIMLSPMFPDSLARDLLNGIFVADSKLYFKDINLAQYYAILYITAGRLLWLDPDANGSFQLLARALKKALELGKLAEEDLFKTDTEVMKILEDIDDPEVSKYLERLNPQTKFVYANESEAEFYGHNKPRVVDPWVEVDGKLVRISEITPRLKEFFDHYKKTYQMIGVKEA